LITETNSDTAIELIRKTIGEGAEAYCLLMNMLAPQDKAPEKMKRILDAMEGRPSYIANYINGNSQKELTDDDLAEELLQMAQLGANLIDIRTDMFCRTHGEVTRDLLAVRKQKELISEIHKIGSEVLMSTHIGSYMSPESVLEVGMMQRERGVDIAKIVTLADSERERDDAFRTTLLLKEKLNIPFLFLCNGSHCKNHRLLNPVLGSCMYLCRENSNTGTVQPTLEAARAVREMFFA
jgi:3-dehydroquinate dehydratase